MKRKRVCESVQLQEILVLFVDIILNKFNYFYVLCTCRRVLSIDPLVNGNCRYPSRFKLAKIFFLFFSFSHVLLSAKRIILTFIFGFKFVFAFSEAVVKKLFRGVTTIL